MSDDPLKKRMLRAKQKARDDLRALGYEVVVSDNQPICLVAYRGSEVRIIRICLDEAAAIDKKRLMIYSGSPIVSREIWVRALSAERFAITKL